MSKKLMKKYAVTLFVLVAVAFAATAVFTFAQKSSGNPAAENAHGGKPAKATEARELRISFAVEPTGDGEAGSEPVREGGYAQVLFEVTDRKTGAPASSLDLAAWVSLTDETAEAEACEDRIKRYVQGLLGLHADIDLNKYFILVLNNDQTISVIDPLLGMTGITHLFDMIVLPERGEDWVADPDGKYLYVSIPRVGLVTRVDLASFEVIESMPAGEVPVRLALHPDGRHLWVGNDGRGRGGVTVIDLQRTRSPVFIETGAGHHEIAFSADGRWGYVTNSADNTVSVVNASSMSKAEDLPTGENPVAVAFSNKANAAYVLAEGDGAVTVVDGTAPRVARTIQTDPGSISLRFDHHGRWGLMANFRRDRVDVIDALKGEIVHRIPVGRQPHQIAFTHMHAYVRHLGTSDVALIKLADLGNEGLPQSLKVAFGNKAPGQYRYTSLADSISAAGHMAAVIGANPAEKVLYHYMEGMMVPMGSYSTYGRIPRAVRVADRSVREVEPGVYAAKIKVPKSGIYNVSLLVKSPRVIQCFNFEAQRQTLSAASERRPAEIRIEYIDPRRTVTAGESFPIEFRLELDTDGGGHKPITGLRDVMVSVTRMPGNRPQRLIAAEVGEGRYSVNMNVNDPGAYYVFVSVPSLQVDSAQMKYLVLNALPAGI